MALNLAQFPSDGCFPFRSKRKKKSLAKCFCHLQRCCRSRLPSEVTRPVLSLLWLPQISNSTDSDCTPKLFVISSKVRGTIPALVSALSPAGPAPGRPASENVLKVVVDSADESHAWEGWAVSVRDVGAPCSCRSHSCHT